MRIQPINNIQQTQFKAKFPKQDIEQFLTEIDKKDRGEAPQLYTLLEFIKNLPQKSANIKHFGIWNQIHLDGKSITNERTYINAYHALYDTVVANRNSLVKDNGIKRLTEEEFENNWYKNANKTIQDIENLAEK